MTSAFDSQRTARQADYVGLTSHLQQQQSSQQGVFSNGEVVESPAGSQQPEAQPLSQMSELDRYGMAGMLSRGDYQADDVRSLAKGHDLTDLGLDLNQTEPLHPSFSTPFTPAAPLRPLESDYTVPACYTVANVPPLHNRISGFTDETLFFIFYDSPRDLTQEFVADELVGRKWRFHKGEKMWVTRDETYNSPVEVERGVSESGFYVWWDWKSWKKVRRQYVLRYEDLDDRANRSGNANAAAGLGVGIGAPSNALGSGGGFSAMTATPSSAGGGLMGFGRGF